MSGLSLGADGRDSYPLRLRSGPAFRLSMRRLTPNPLRVPSACFPQANGEVTSTEEKQSRPSGQRAESRLLRRPFFTTATAPPTQTRTERHAPVSSSHLRRYAKLLRASHHRFHTHSALVGPRFS